MKEEINRISDKQNGWIRVVDTMIYKYLVKT